MIILKFCDIYDFALIAITIICAYMIFKDKEKNNLSKLLIIIDLLLVIRTLTITKLLKKGILGQENCEDKPKQKKKKQRVIVLDEEEDDDDTEDIEEKKRAEGFRSYLAGKVGAK